MKVSKIILVLAMLVGMAQADVQSNMAKAQLTAELQGLEGNKEAEINALIKKMDSVGYSTCSSQYTY